MMIKKENLEKFMENLESAQWMGLELSCCKLIAEALSYPKAIPNEYWYSIDYNQFDNLFYLTLKLPQKKFTKKEMRQIQDEIAKRIMEELANPSYIRIYPNITTAAAFNYFSLFHALALLNIPEWKIDIPTPEQNFEYNLAYGLFKLDDRSKEFDIKIMKTSTKRKERKIMNKFMKIAKERSINGCRNHEGGPFGAVIVDKEGNVIAEGNNRVLCDLDPTAHAEVTTIREACKKLRTYDLSNYILYTSCEPCPMCLSAIIWSNIKEVYYGCTKEDAGNIGFRDDIIYKYLEGKNKDLINLKQMDRDECIEAFNEYSKNNGTIY